MPMFGSFGVAAWGQSPPLLSPHNFGDVVTSWYQHLNPRLRPTTDAAVGGFNAVGAGSLYSCGLRTDDTITS